MKAACLVLFGLLFPFAESTGFALTSEPARPPQWASKQAGVDAETLATGSPITGKRDEAAQADYTDLETVKARLLADARGKPPDLKKLRWLMQIQKADGSWEGIPYGARDITIWPPMEHLDRLAVLARGCEAGGRPEAERAAGAGAFVKGFDFWVARDPKSENWWYNEIGAPLTLYRIMLLTEPLLTAGRLEKGCALLARAKLGMTGQNLAWVAENVIGRACLQDDTKLLSEAFRRMEAEIQVTEQDGIQPDFSFHQHGAQFYSGGYGNGFAASATKFALLAQGTSFAFAPEKLRIVEDYLLDGQQWMIRGNVFDYSAGGRELTRPDSGKPTSYASIATSLLKVAAVTRRAELERFAARTEGPTNRIASPLKGHRHFWCSDYTVHHRSEWMVSVRMTSDRLLQSELVDGENLLGEHLSDGVTYLYRTGDEYRDIFPVWDWARLPGITAEYDRPPQRINNQRRGTRAFAGGCSDGTCGVSAMAFERDGLTAKKAWFFFDDEVVCLGADIASSNGYRVITSVNQCLADGPVTVRQAGSAATALTAHQRIEKPAWLYHGGVGYVFLDASDSIDAGISVQTGSWRRISTAQKADPVSMPVFSLWVNHGKHPRGATYAYVATPRRDAAELDAYAAALPVRVVVNTSGAQGVEQARTGMLQAAFYRAGSIASEKWGTVSVDAPCLLMLTPAAGKVRVTVCNPCNQAGLVRVSIGKQVGTVQLPAGPRAGESVTVAL